jgi:hypothetical protein
VESNSQASALAILCGAAAVMYDVGIAESWKRFSTSASVMIKESTELVYMHVKAQQLVKGSRLKPTKCTLATLLSNDGLLSDYGQVLS